MHGELVNYAHVLATPLCVCVCGPQLCVFISSMAHSDECLMLTHFRVSMVTGGHWPRVVSERQAHSSSYTATWPVWGSCRCSLKLDLISITLFHFSSFFSGGGLCWGSVKDGERTGGKWSNPQALTSDWLIRLWRHQMLEAQSGRFPSMELSDSLSSRILEHHCSSRSAYWLIIISPGKVMAVKWSEIRQQQLMEPRTYVDPSG